MAVGEMQVWRTFVSISAAGMVTLHDAEPAGSNGTIVKVFEMVYYDIRRIAIHLARVFPHMRAQAHPTGPIPVCLHEDGVPRNKRGTQYMESVTFTLRDFNEQFANTPHAKVLVALIPTVYGMSDKVPAGTSLCFVAATA